MARISSEAIVAAVRQYEAMSFEQKQALGDVLYREQPVLLGSVLVQHRLGVSMDKIDFLLRLLSICFLAMKAAGGQWPAITEDHQEAQFEHLLQALPLHLDPNSPKADAALRNYLQGHPERELLAYVFGSMNDWLQTIVPAESDKYLMLAAYNIVDCIAHPQKARPVQPIPKIGTSRRRFRQ